MTLYVSDLDGTLLNSASQLSPQTAQILNRLIGEGMLFTYATARSIHSASIVTEGLCLRLPVVVYNGAFLMETGSKRVIASSAFSPAFRTELRNFLAAQSISPLVYSFVDGVERVSWQAGRENEGMRFYLDNRKGDRRLRCVRTEEELYAGEIFYCTLIGERERLRPAAERFSGRADCNCTFQQELYRPEYWCEIMPKEATKANAVLRLKELLGAGRIVSFGDAVNDLPMFAVSDECYAVGSAAPELVAAATGVLPSSDNDSVARWLEAAWNQTPHC